MNGVKNQIALQAVRKKEAGVETSIIGTFD